MAKDCMVEELIGVVNNPELPVLDSFEIVVKPSTFQIKTEVPNGTIISFDNENDDIYAGSIKITSPFTQIYGDGTDRWHATLTQETTFLFRGALYKNSLLEFGGAGTDPQIYHIDGGYIKSMLFYGILDDLYIPSPITTNGLEIDLSAFEELNKNFKRFLIAKTSDITVKGRIVNFAYSTSLTLLALQRRGEFITGKVESMVSGMSKLGRTSGILQMDLRYNANTFRNLPVENSTSGYLNVEFSATGATVKDANNTLLATYTKASDTWAYE